MISFHMLKRRRNKAQGIEILHLSTWYSSQFVAVRGLSEPLPAVGDLTFSKLSSVLWR